MEEVKKKDLGDHLAEWFMKLFFWGLGIVGVILFFAGNLFLALVGAVLFCIFLIMEFPGSGFIGGKR